MSARTFTFVIASRDAFGVERAIASIANQRYPAEHIEVLVAIGTNPSAQRNEAVARAEGEIVYFIDDDSVLDEGCLRYLDETFDRAPDVAGIGGPSVGFDEDGLVQKGIGVAMASVFGLGPVRHRFYPAGRIRRASENELILCNLAMRRDAFARHEGFDTRLYPNEENEFVNRLQDRGERFLYHPLAIVSRSPRDGLFALARQNFLYGASRMKHFRLRPKFINALLLLPMALFAYALFASGVVANEIHKYGGLSFLGASWWDPRWWFLTPAAMYLNCLAFASVFGALSVGRRRAQTLLVLLFVFPTIHLSYGLGMWTGLFRSRGRGRPYAPIDVRRVKALGDAFPEDVASLLG